MSEAPATSRRTAMRFVRLLDSAMTGIGRAGLALLCVAGLLAITDTPLWVVPLPGPAWNPMAIAIAGGALVIISLAAGGPLGILTSAHPRTPEVMEMVIAATFCSFVGMLAGAAVIEWPWAPPSGALQD